MYKNILPDRIHSYMLKQRFKAGFFGSKAWQNEESANDR